MRSIVDHVEAARVATGNDLTDIDVQWLLTPPKILPWLNGVDVYVAEEPDYVQYGRLKTSFQ